jgi:alkylation response protein AidB-like acyl-CoA dehydrogenase
MFSFEPTEEQQMLIDAVDRFAKNDLRTAAHDAEEGKAFPPKLIGKGWELGVLQASIPEAYGGFGDRSAVTGILASEQLGYGDLASAIAVMTPGLFVMPILIAGNEDQKKKWIAPVIEGDWTEHTAALIEPAFDFDPSALKTSAKLEGGSYVINGVKMNVPYADQAEAMIVYADLDGQTQGFIVPAKTDGVNVGEREKLMSLNALPLFRVTFEGVRIDPANRLGGDQGHSVDPILAAMRVANASLAIGVAQGAFEYARDYAKQRDAFGMKIAQKQAIAFMLAEMGIEIEAVRLLTWEAAWKIDAGKDDAFVSAYLASTGAADMVMMVTDRAVQILGGHGYIREYPVEMWMRNGRGFASLLGLAIV